MKRNKFTLIELLVVTVIIMILCAMLFPCFAKIRNKAKSIDCMGNTKYLAMGLLRYALDNDDNFIPYQKRNVSAGTWNWAWGLKNDGYVKRDAFRCRAAENVLTNKLTYGSHDIWHKDIAGSYYYIAYGYNFYYIGGSGGVDPSFEMRHVPAKCNQIAKPSETVSFADVYNSLDSAFNLFVPNHTNNTLAIHDRHLGGSQLTYLDGHVDWMSNARLNVQLKTNHYLMDRN